jgi:energy-coupling factor transporter transmembrane protein EcfT
MSTNQIIGVFDDESVLLEATKKLKANGVNIKDIYGPSADHDLIKTFTKESRLPFLSVATGVITILLTFAFVYYVTVIDYPLHYGGKPVFSFPPMVIIMFLVCILVTGAFTTFSFLTSEKMYPGKNPRLVHPRAAIDRFYLVLGRNFNPEEIKQWLKESGVEEIIEEKTYA